MVPPLPRGESGRWDIRLPCGGLVVRDCPCRRLPSFKVSTVEAGLIRALAKQERASLSEYLRRRATGMGKEPVLPELKR